ncbi:S-adenosyl-L-methionine-dependent methyltransferase [Hypoxylon cercidicola]|nr:S-adenosyl-L-methionine-dependent methyltransferase [Hypoxylon cercidicola]
MLSETDRIEALEAARKLVAYLSDESESSRSESTRVQAVRTANGLVRSIEKPEDGLMKLAYSPAVWMAIRICVHLNIFNIIVEKEIISVEGIAERSGADEALLRRLLRVLTSYGYVAEKGVGLYGVNKWTKHLQSRVTQGMVKFIFDLSMPPITAALEFFKENHFQNPVDPRNGLFQKGFDVDIPPFQWLALPENKELWDDANTFFEGDRGSRPSWVTWFPVKDKLLTGKIDDQAPLLVDIAGGRGHDLMEFIGQFPSMKGKYVLHDQQQVLDSTINLPSTVEKRAIDFFYEAPVQGAKIYFMKFIMHDFADPQALRILNHVASSMKKGYSYLVINDFILPDTGCPLIATEWDLMMLVIMSSMERTEPQWRSLLGAAGLSIKGLYQPPGDGQGIIVATL